MRNVPDRHRSLRAVFDRSWSLLSYTERRALAQLSVFRGGFDLDAAEQVSGASLGLLAALSDKSMVRPALTGRYDLHELVRQYLSDKLVESREAGAVTGRHFDFYSRLSDAAEAQLYGPDQEVWFDRLEIDYYNLAAALDEALKDDRAESGLRMAAALGSFWEHRGHFHDAYAWLERLLERECGAPAPVRAKALRTAGVFAMYVRESHEATARCEEALALARQVGDQWNIAWCLAHLVFFVDPTSSNLTRAVRLLEEALRLFRAMGDGWGTSHALRRLGWIVTMQGDYEQAATLLEEALTLARRAQNKHALSWSLFLLGNVVWLQSKDPARSVALYEESLSLIGETRDRHHLQYVLLMLGQVAYAQGNFERTQSRYDEVVALAQELGGVNTWDLRPVVLGYAQLAVAIGQPDLAARLFGAAHVVHAHPYLELGDRRDIDRDIAAARDQLGEAVFASACAQGRAMAIEQALAYALHGRVVKRTPVQAWTQATRRVLAE